MSNIIHKVEEKLGMGGDHKDGGKKHHDDHKKSDHKEGIIDKVKDKVSGDHHGHGHGDGKKKDKKKKKHEDGHKHGDDSSGSESD